MTVVLILIAVAALAYANGNFKGVATLFGSGTTGYGKALAWATVAGAAAAFPSLGSTPLIMAATSHIDRLNCIESLSGPIPRRCEVRRIRLASFANRPMARILSPLVKRRAEVRPFSGASK